MTVDVDRGFLDAAAPFVQPREVERWLPALAAGKTSTVLTTVASIQDSSYTLGIFAEWLELERSGRLPIALTRSVEEVERAIEAEKLAIVLHFQGAAPIEEDLNLLDAYYALGLRVVQLTYNFANRLGDGCLERRDAGLTQFGRNAIERMNELGIVVDVAHVGRRTSLEAVEASTAPVIVSHANARAVYDSRRNLNDEQIDAIAESGGVIGVCAFPGFVAAEEPNLEHLLDHIDYLVERVGDEHVGYGFDFADEDEADYVYYRYEDDTYPHPPWTYPPGIAGFADIANVADGMRKRGYSEEQVGRIGGGNFLRVFGEIWKAP